MTNPTTYTVGQRLVVTRPNYLHEEGNKTAPFGIPFGTSAIVIGVLDVGDGHVNVDLAPNASGKTSWQGVHPDWFVPAPDIKVGQPITDAEDWNSLPVGATATDKDGWIHTKVGDYDPDHEHRRTATYVDCDGEIGIFKRPWNWGLTLTSLPEPEAEAPARPLIDFSLGRYDTASTYAAVADSRVLKSESRTALRAAAAGEKVDAYALNAAVVDAMRSATTRVGQSMGRRDLATKIAHLGHIAQATIENHADRLPAYEQGQRSRKIETLEGEVAAFRTALEASHADAQEYRTTADAEVSRLLEENDTLRQEVDTLRQEVDDNHAQAVVEGVELQGTIDSLAASLDYALGLLATLNEGASFQALGFMDAHGVELV